jgi:hypothetical protein
MDAKEKRNLETGLMQMGLAGLQADGSPSAELVQWIADIVNHWDGYENRLGEWVDKHKFLRDLLNECVADARSEMYTAICPKLTFKPLRLEDYESMIALKAGALVSQRRARVTGDAPKPIEVGGIRYAAAPKFIATNVVATLRCHRCNVVTQFVAPTPAGAMIEGRKAGWTREAGINKETCPECSIAVAETIVRLSNKEVLAVYDRRSCKLDA